MTKKQRAQERDRIVNYLNNVTGVSIREGIDMYSIPTRFGNFDLEIRFAEEGYVTVFGRFTEEKYFKQASEYIGSSEGSGKFNNHNTTADRFLMAMRLLVFEYMENFKYIVEGAGIFVSKIEGRKYSLITIEDFIEDLAQKDIDCKPTGDGRMILASENLNRCFFMEAGRDRFPCLQSKSTKVINAFDILMTDGQVIFPPFNYTYEEMRGDWDV